MKVDLSIGANQKQFCLAWYNERGNNKPLDSIAIISIMSNLPVIVITHWMAEWTGYSQELKERRDAIVKFYGYTEIVNVPKDCPWGEV